MEPELSFFKLIKSVMMLDAWTILSVNHSQRVKESWAVIFNQSGESFTDLFHVDCN